MSEPEYLTVEEVGSKLRLTYSTVRRLAERRNIPGAIKVGGQWRFEKVVFEEWLATAGNTKEAKP